MGFGLLIVSLRWNWQRKKPLLQNQQLQVPLKSAAVYINKPNAFWRKDLWIDETKIELSDHHDKMYVWRSKDEVFKPKNIVLVVMHGGGSLMLWGCLALSGLEHSWVLHQVKDEKHF